MHILLPLVLGWAAGMVANYLADILPRHRWPVAPVCLKCGAEQPLASYLFWPRRCQDCGQRRPWRVWLVEAILTGLTLWIWITPPQALGFPAGFILLIYFTTVVVIDLEHRLILHPVSLAGAGIGLILGTGLHGLWPTLLGGAAGFASMLALYYLGFLYARFIARRRGLDPDEEALGFGDVNLSGVLGLLLGWPGITLGLVLGILAGGLASLILLLGMALSRRYRPFLAIPYGPFLVAGAFALLFLLS